MASRELAEPVESASRCRERADESLFAFGFQEVSRPTFSVGEQERKEIYKAAWKRGGGFRFMFETFGDISIDEAANKEASNFIKANIRETVKDENKARKLMPTQLYARRPLCDSGYYEQFNRDNVAVVSLAETLIERMPPKGTLTTDGTEYELDAIIFATGFDAVDGNYTRVAIQGREGNSQLALGRGGSDIVPGRPNGLFSNLPPAIETQVEFISDTIEKADKVSLDDTNGLSRTDSVTGKRSSSPMVEALAESEERWTEECDKLSAGSLFRRTDSWIFGSNVAGKKSSILFYFAGLSAHRKVLARRS
ncbi:hypothetical protein B0A48_18875 [Cryoendolithus antarcticus]|uniref:FAD/NAD(P)-binding domain-containing protein n=1 Tax=Cryoendolithus antarcticus TaxID=1507870 RepID=A0A1V8S776_9PEZI|nr:hypothetical protein B0A48_18875 [Cryoendolithus antarcticus]